MLKRFLYWWNNPEQKELKTKVEKPLTWRQEMESRRMQIIKEAEQEKRNNKKDSDEADGMFAVFIILLLLPVSLFIMWIAMDTNDKQPKRESCEAIGGSFEVVDTTYAGNIVVKIYGCVK